jgi:hypothetical protein
MARTQPTSMWSPRSCPAGLRFSQGSLKPYDVSALQFGSLAARRPSTAFFDALLAKA